MKFKKNIDLSEYLNFLTNNYSAYGIDYKKLSMYRKSEFAKKN